jgi:response regulator RpfG family c-di-GMP phosphodiesterase
MTIAEAIDEIEKCAGTQFDPDIAARFVTEMRKTL